MPHGGKRTGAGRPPGTSVLDWLETLAVAGQCQRRWHEDYERRLKAAQDAHFARSDYLEATARVRASLGNDGEALEDVEYSRREMAGMDADDEADAPRLISFRVPRPYALKGKIIEEVAAWASQEFGKRVTPHLVQSAWSLLKKVEAKTRFD